MGNPRVREVLRRHLGRRWTRGGGELGWCMLCIFWQLLAMQSGERDGDIVEWA